MGTVIQAGHPQTLYVTMRRDELRELKDERDELKLQVAQLTSMLMQAKALSGPAMARIA